MIQFSDIEMKNKFNCKIRFKNTHNKKVIGLPVMQISEADSALQEARGRYKNFILIGYDFNDDIHYALTGGMLKSEICLLLIFLQKFTNVWVSE